MPPNAARVRRITVSALALLLFAAAASAASLEKTYYSASSNNDLKQRAARLAKSIRELIDSHNRKDRDLLGAYDKKSRPGTDADRALRERWLRESDAIHDSTLRYYRDNYWSDAILLVDEMYRRLPPRARRTDVLPIYQYPTNVLGLQTIANHLETTSKSLP